MGDLSDLRKARAVLAYVHVQRKNSPLPGQKVKVIEDPVIFDGMALEADGSMLATSYRTGIEEICIAPSTTGAGGLLIAAQVKRFIRWKIGYVSQNGWTEEKHYIFISIPVLTKIPGPRMALMSITPWQLKLIPYAGLVVKLFSKIREVENAMAIVLKFKGAFDATERQLMIAGLNLLESALNEQIRNLMYEASDDKVVQKLDRRPSNVPFFVATSTA